MFVCHLGIPDNYPILQTIFRRMHLNYKRVVTDIFMLYRNIIQQICSVTLVSYWNEKFEKVSKKTINQTNKDTKTDWPTNKQAKRKTQSKRTKLQLGLHHKVHISLGSTALFGHFWKYLQFSLNQKRTTANCLLFLTLTESRCSRHNRERNRILKREAVSSRRLLFQWGLNLSASVYPNVPPAAVKMQTLST